MITFENLYFNYKGGKELFGGLNLNIKTGERIAVWGESGKGKSTLLRLIMGLEKAKKGKVILKDNITFSVVFQDDRLIPFKTALENAELFENGFSAKDILCELGLGDSLSQLPEELSGGMKRRVALARALARKSDVLILDEAFTGLDQNTKLLCINCIEKYLDSRTLILVSHESENLELLNCKTIEL